MIRYVMCAALMAASGGAVSGRAISTLHPRDIYNRSASLDNREVTVTGFLIRGRCLYQSRNRFRAFESGFRTGRKSFDPKDFSFDGITLLGLEASGKPLRTLDGRVVSIHGVLKSNYLDGYVLDLHACGRAALVVTKDEAERVAGSFFHK